MATTFEDLLGRLVLAVMNEQLQHARDTSRTLYAYCVRHNCDVDIRSHLPEALGDFGDLVADTYDEAIEGLSPGACHCGKIVNDGTPVIPLLVKQRKRSKPIRLPPKSDAKVYPFALNRQRVASVH